MQEANNTDPGKMDELEARLESLSCMAFGISHDLNNMLAAILSNTEAALDQLPPDNATRTYLEHIESNTRKAINLSRCVQRMTEDGSLTSESICLATFATQLTNILEKTCPETCSLCVDELDSTCMIHSSPELLQEAALAIVQNAIESLTQEQGEVHIRVFHKIPPETKNHSISLGKIPTQACATLEIRDTGRGISPEALNRIFDPFFSTYLRKQGLGLIPVIGLVHSCDVAIQVQSELENGTIVRLFFRE